MISDLIQKNEGKTLEFKQNTQPLAKIIQTIIAFANTAGGTIVIGIEDTKKKVIGIQNILKEEERLASAIADSIEPLLTPTLQLSTWRKKDLLIIHVPYSPGPYYLKSKGKNNGTYVRFGSTNRLADHATIDSISRLQQRVAYDELPMSLAKKDDLDLELAKDLFADVDKRCSEQQARSLGLFIRHQNKDLPSVGGLLLFGKKGKRTDLFPNAIIRCAKFRGKTKATFLDQIDFTEPLPLAVDVILGFIRKHSTVGFEINTARRKEIHQYPPQVIREAVINALVHTDYSIKGSNIQIAIFDDRIEVSNPGALPFGLSLETALSGFSLLRNKVIGRVFQELRFIEHWGTGLGKMVQICQEQGIHRPLFEELDNYFKVTIFQRTFKKQLLGPWEHKLLKQLQKHGSLTAKQAQKIWEITPRTTSNRLKKMVERGLVVEVGTGPYDPQKKFVIPK